MRLLAVRQGFKPLPHSLSRLKPTAIIRLKLVRCAVRTYKNRVFPVKVTRYKLAKFIFVTSPATTLTVCWI
jgi:hypothetical protein